MGHIAIHHQIMDDAIAAPLKPDTMVQRKVQERPVSGEAKVQ